jgi:uncharacterized protein YdaT
MPFTEDAYPQSWKNVAAPVRDKAIEIANALLADDMPEQRAIPIALSKAREAVGETSSQAQWVIPHDDGWAVKTENTDQPRKVFDTQAEAIDDAVAYAKDHETTVTVLKADGQIRDRQSFRSRL